MLRAIVIDDNRQMQSEVTERAKAFFPKEIAIVAEATNVGDGLKVIESYEPELIFLDVQLSDGTGFDLLEQSVYKNFEVIFITGYDSNAMKAIKVGALDFILKPIDDDEFKKAVEKAIITKNKEKHLQQLITVAQNHYKGIDTNRIVLKTTDSLYLLQEDDILYCQGDGNYTTVFTKNQGNILISNHLKKMEELFSEIVFVRCHQSYLVNKRHVLKYSKRGFLVLISKAEVPVSARRKEFTLKNVFG